MQFNYQEYIAENQIPDTAKSLTITYNTGLYELIWAAAMNGWVPPSVIIANTPVPEGEPTPATPTVDDDIADLLNWSTQAMNKLMLDELSRTKIALEQRRKAAELEQIAAQTQAFINSKLIVSHG